jgi:hypothetical protein
MGGHRFFGDVVVGAGESPQELRRRHALALELAFEVILPTHQTCTEI